MLLSGAFQLSRLLLVRCIPGTAWSKVAMTSSGQFCWSRRTLLTPRMQFRSQPRPPLAITPELLVATTAHPTTLSARHSTFSRDLSVFSYLLSRVVSSCQLTARPRNQDPRPTQLNSHSVELRRTKWQAVSSRASYYSLTRMHTDAPQDRSLRSFPCSL